MMGAGFDVIMVTAENGTKLRNLAGHPGPRAGMTELLVLLDISA